MCDIISEVLYLTSLLNTLNKSRRNRRKHWCNIVAEMRKRNALILALFNNSRIERRLWTVERYGTFWEQDVPNNSDAFFKENFRMTRKCFEILCGYLKNMTKEDTTYRLCIPLDKRLAIALYTLRSSAEYGTISRLFGVSKASVCVILKEFCLKVWKVMAPEYLSSNFVTQDNVTECVKGFEAIGFPQCFGAIDGCHIEVRPELNEAIDYYNYKGWYSMILLALVDHRYRFTYINVGAPGRCNDSLVFENSTLKSTLQHPIFKDNAKCIFGVNVPVVIIGDSAFRFSEYLLKPYPFHSLAEEKEKNFNYRLSKARRVVENAFGHLKARFRRIGKGIDNNIENATSIIKCCCVLHNFLNNHNDFINEKWMENLKNLENNERAQPQYVDTLMDNHPAAEIIRNAIAQHFGVAHIGDSVPFGVEGLDGTASGESQL